VKVQQPQTLLHFFGAQHVGGRQQLRSIEAKLGVFPAAFSPFARPLADEADADADERFDTHLP